MQERDSIGLFGALLPPFTARGRCGCVAVYNGRVVTRDGRVLMRGDRVLVSDESVLGDPKPRLGLVIAFAPEDNRWHAVVILDEPTGAGTSVVAVEPSSTT